MSPFFFSEPMPVTRSHRIFLSSRSFSLFLLMGLATVLSCGTAVAATFPIQIKQNQVVQCSLNGSLLSINPQTGNVTINLATESSCYSGYIDALRNATLVVTSPTTLSGGSGIVNLTLNTNLPSVSNGVTCLPDGTVGSNVTATSGWSTTLCTNCGPTATRSVVVNGVGTIAFKAKCQYQDPSTPNLLSIRANIQSGFVIVNP